MALGTPAGVGLGAEPCLGMLGLLRAGCGALGGSGIGGATFSVVMRGCLQC